MEQDPNEIVKLTCSVWMLLQKRDLEGRVSPAECLELPQTMTRQAAENLIRQGLIPPDCVVPLDPPPPADRC
jgi:hypothetical protein